MASNKIKGITIEIGADTTGLDKALKNVEKGANNAKSELRDVDRAMKNAPDSAVLWSQKQELLTKAIEESKKKLELLKNAQEQVDKQFKEGKIGEDQYRAFQREVEKAKAELKKFEDQLNDLESAADDASDDVDDLGDNTEEAGEQAEKSGDGFTTLKGAIADLAADGIRAAIDGFKELATEGDTALNNLQAKTGATAEQMEEYRDIMTNLYANNYGEDKIDIAGSIAEVKQQLGEISSEELEEATEQALLMRDTFDFEVNESIRAAKMLMEQFEISADEAYTLIAQGAQNGLNKNDDLLDTINEYGVHYKSLGYSAEEFFNSLSNGTEAGTFSVDKLGDAVKEFNIRQKEGADETVSAWAKLGIVQADQTEAISETQEKIDKEIEQIAKLKKQLEYARIEQDNFTESTSELTKLKMSDNISDWETELAELEETLATDNVALDTFKNYTSNAKYTVDELMAAFNNGGEEAKEATNDVVDALFALEDETLKNQIGVQLFGTMWEDLQASGVQALTNVKGEADKTATTLRDIADVKYNDLGTQFQQLGREVKTELLEPIAEKALPILKDGTDYLIQKLPKIEDKAKKLLPLVEGIASGFVAWKAINGVSKGITTVKKLSAAIKGGNTIMKALNATMAVNPYVAVAAGVVGLTGALVGLAAAYEAPKSEIEKAIEVEKEYAEKLERTAEEYQEKKDAAYEAAEADLAQIEKADLLWQELENLADSSGKVKDKDKERAEFILGELNEALDAEYTLTGNQIDQYDELKNSIEKVIEAKRANILLGAAETVYSEAVTKKSETEEELAKKQGELNETEAKLLAIRNEAASKGLGNISSYDLDTVGAILSDKGINPDEYRDLMELQKTQTDSLRDLRDQLYTYYDDIEKYETASAAILNENYDEAVKILDDKGEAFVEATEVLGKDWEEQKDILDEQVKYYKRIYENKLKAVEDGHEAISSAEIEAAKENYERAVAEAETVSKAYNTHYADGINSTKNLPIDAMSMSAAEMVQKAKGYSGDMYDAGYGLQTALFNGMTAAQLYLKNTLIQKAINSPGDLAMFNAGTYVPYMAEGGVLRSGSAVVAEAGPELLSITTGGVQVTPLTSTAKNTALNEAGMGQKTVNIFNTIKVDKISSDYDVTRLSERLSFEERRAEMGKGK